MKVGYDAERWQHFFGDLNHLGNQVHTIALLSLISHQLTSAQKLGKQI